MSRLVVLHQGAIGDFILTLSVIQEVRATLGAGHVVVIASAASARLAAGRGDVDAWVSPDAVGLYRLFCGDLELEQRLSAILAEADHVLNFLGGRSGSIHDRLGAAVGGEVVSVDPRPDGQTRATRRHITAQWAQDIRQAGWDISEPGPARIRLNRPGPSAVPRVLLHPGSGGRAKCWPLERFGGLAEWLQRPAGTAPARHGAEVTWMLGPAEVQQARAVREQAESFLVEEDLEKAAEQMSRFDLYVGNDSGMSHLAAAIGLPSVIIFGATDPAIWRPLGQHVSIVAPPKPAQTMDAVCPDEVRAAVLGRLAEY